MLYDMVNEFENTILVGKLNFIYNDYVIFSK